MQKLKRLLVLIWLIFSGVVGQLAVGIIGAMAIIVFGAVFIFDRFIRR